MVWISGVDLHSSTSSRVSKFKSLTFIEVLKTLVHCSAVSQKYAPRFVTLLKL